MSTRTIIIRGTQQPETAYLHTEQLEAVASYRVGRLNRSAGAEQQIEVSDDQLIELVFDDDTVWLCNSDTLQEVFPEAPAVQRGAVTAFVLPDEVQAGGERGLLGNIGLKIINVFKKKAVTDVVKTVAGGIIENKVRAAATSVENKQLGAVRGLWRLNDDFSFQPLNDVVTDKPCLLFLHGTASSTEGSFGEMRGTAEWQQLRSTYGANVLAFQHETLTKSPLQNVLELVRQLPANSVLHLVSHSRGGLVGDLLCRFGTVNEAQRGFEPRELDYLRQNGHEDALQLIDEIGDVLKTKQFVVRKFVRVACPAAGTTLASDRIEHFFNITLNLIGIGTGMNANPIYGAFKDLVAAILETKDNDQVLPGLGAMNPSSDFIKVLNWPDSAVVVDSPLAVIAGNCKVKPNLKALLIIASKLFYREDNDLVVHTASMFRGSRRTRPVQYYFDATPDTDHFHYFKNDRTAKLLVQALLAADADQLVPGFTLLPAEGWGAQRGVFGLEGGKLTRTTVTGRKPIVVLLPGIMGSTLDAGSDAVWIDYAGFLVGGLGKLAIGQKDITASGIISTSYQRLADFLSTSYDVVTFAFDWRLDLQTAARQLDARMRELLAYNQPIKVIAHSMGGVLMRDLMVLHPATWQQLNRAPGFRLIMLGSPLRGSYRIPAVLFGRDPIIDKLSAIDLRHSKRELVDIFARFPGILALLPLTKGPGQDFADLATWEAMKDAAGDQRWPLPPASLLADFGQYRDEVLDKLPTLDLANVVYVAGRDQATASGYRILNAGGRKELQFLYTAEGDQSVTWDSGILPQLVAANAVYYANVSHGALANEKQLFNGLLDLLTHGVTMALSRTRPVVRAVAPTATPVRAEDFDLSRGGVIKTLLGLTDAPVPADDVTVQPLRVRVSNGDLRYASFPLLVGHFATDGILSAEQEIDRHLGGALSERYALGIYPGDIGTSEIFVPLQGDYPGAVVMGLGEFGQLTAFRLMRTVEQGVARYLHALAVRQNQRGPVGSANVSALLVGSSFGGLTVEDAVRAIVTGVRNANAKVSKLLGDRAPAVALVEFVESYQDTAINCFYAARRIEQNDNRLLQVEGHTIRTLFGAKKRLLTGPATGWWNRLAVRLAQPLTEDDQVRELDFVMATGRAREEKQTLLLNPRLIDELLRQISAQNAWTPQLATAVFNLLIPYDLREAVQRQGNLNLILDAVTAEYPWELLQDGGGDAKPLCVSAGMIRQYTTPDYRHVIRPVAQDTALVIGDPVLDGFLPQLDGALREAQEVSTLLTGSPVQPTTRLRPRAGEVVEQLFRADYKIVHLAGHGVFDPAHPELSGMVIGNRTFLTTAQFAQMGAPELAFVNCCFLGQMSSKDEHYYQNRYRLAANIGTQLIRNGARAVVVAGWAVDDAAALTFARTFYRAMLDGSTFGDAVLLARRKVYDEARENGQRHNTWGAYQAYGDPHYRLFNTPAAAPAERNYTLAEEALIDLRNVLNDLDGGRYRRADVLASVATIMQAVERCGIGAPSLTECEAFIYTELYEYERALEAFHRLLKAENAEFTVATLEKYCNVRAKLAVQQFLILSAQNPTARVLREARKAALKEVEEANRLIHDMLQIGRTSERLNLLGSVAKRRAQVLAPGAERISAYREAADYYQAAAEVAQGNAAIYAVTSWYQLETVVGLLPADEAAAREAPAPAVMRQRLQTLGRAGMATTMDYWTMLEEANLLLTTLLLDPAQPVEETQWQELLLKYQALWRKAGSKNKRMAEIEHVRFLKEAFDDAAGNPRPGAPNLDGIRVQLARLLEALEVMIND